MASIPSTTPPVRFSDFPNFTPFYTPTQMLELGVFGGAYFHLISIYSSVPPQVFDGVALNKYRNGVEMASDNYFGVLTTKRNRDISLLAKSYHPAGWFQWYCSFYYGQRNNAVDRSRINQWAEELKTLSFQIRNGTYTQEGNRWTDAEAFKEWKQHLLQFGWDPTKDPQTYVLETP